MSTPDAVYGGMRFKDGSVGVIVIYGPCFGQSRDLHPGPSRAVRDHSPDGFNWGYHGSGPAQLALAILLDCTGDPERAGRHYQDFKRAFVAGWGDVWQVPAADVLAWLAAREGGAS